MAHLLLDSPDGSQSTVSILGDELFMGREPSLEVVLNDPKVSRRHVRLWRRQDAFWVEDLGSSNGTQLDGVPLTQAQILSDGSRLDIGPFTLTLRESEGGAQPAPSYLLSSRQPRVVADIPIAAAADAATPGEPLVVGRSDACDVVIADQSISRRHAQLRAVAGGVEVFDFDSSNGTFINDTPVKSGTLTPGDALRLGNIAFALTEISAPTRPKTASFKQDALAQTPSAAPQDHDKKSFWSSLRARSTKVQTSVAASSVRRTVDGRLLVIAALVLALGGVAWVARRAFFQSKGPPPRLSVVAEKVGHLAARITGSGPTPAERRRLDALSSGIARAHALESKDNAAAVESAWSDVLDLDPINAEALVGLFWARELQRQKSALSLATGELAQSNGREALASVASALDTPWAGPKVQEQPPTQNVQVKAALVRAATDAREALARASGDRGTQSCLDSQFELCLSHAAAALGFASAASYGQVLVGWVHDVMGEPYQDMRTRYPEAPLRQAMWAYAAGADEGALVRLKPLACARCVEAYQGVKALIQKRHEAESAQHGAEPQRALELFETCRTDDASLIPASVPSAARRQLSHAMQDAYVSLARASFSRGAYSDALEVLEQGAALMPSYPPVEEQLALLVERGQQLLDAWIRHQKATPGFTKTDACLPVRDVVAMTPVDAAVHHHALELLNACRAGKLNLDNEIPSATDAAQTPVKDSQKTL